MQYLLADFATSRGQDFLTRLQFPWPDLAPGVVEGLRAGFERAIDLGVDPMEQALFDERRFDELLGAQRELTPFEASEVKDWFRAIPQDGATPAFLTGFYWTRVWFWTMPRNMPPPPGLDAATWRAFTAAIDRTPFEGAAHLRQAHAAFLERSQPVVNLLAEVRGWAQGPFSDLDLKLAHALEWDIAEGVACVIWQNALEYRITQALWSTFTTVFSADEKAALVAHRRSEHALAVDDARTLDQEGIAADAARCGVSVDQFLADTMRDHTTHPDDMLA